VAALHARKKPGTERPPVAKVCQEESWLKTAVARTKFARKNPGFLISINSLFEINFGKLMS